MDGPRTGKWTTLAMLEKYIDYQCFLWKEFQLKGENYGRNFHILRYGKVVLAYTWLKLNFVCVCVSVCVCVCVYAVASVLCQLFACQASLSMGFSSQEYQSGLPCLPPGDLPDPGIKPTSLAAPAFQGDSLPLSHWEKPNLNFRLTKTACV